MGLTVTVRFFAAARERAKTGAVTLALPDGATVAQLKEELFRRFPAVGALGHQLRFAVDEEFAEDTTPLRDGGEVALIPPVAGGAPPLFTVTDAPLSLEQVIANVAVPTHGGLVTFTGAVRNQTRGKPVLRLEYEAYVPMAVRQLERIAQEAQVRWPGVLVSVSHRVGTLLPGEAAVAIATSAPHRKDAFLACEHVIDRLKQDVPIWKKELFEDGEVWVGLGP